MEAFVKKINRTLPCRDGYVRQLYRYYRTGDPFPPALYVYGQSSTGKCAILREAFRQWSMDGEGDTDWLRCVQLNAIGCYTNKILFEAIVRQLEGTELSQLNNYASADGKLEYAKDFLAALRQRLDPALSYVIVLRNAERLRDMAHNLLPLFLQLPEATGLNISVVLVSSLPFEKFYTKTGLPPVVKLFVPEYTRAEMQRILMHDYGQHIKSLAGNTPQEWLSALNEEFHRNYVNLFLSTFWKVCRDVKELRLVAAECFPPYCEPIRDGTIPAHDSMKLWRNITKTLKAALSTMYMRLGTRSTSAGSASTDGTAWLAQNLELPYYAKYLLIAAYLASNNAAKEDRRLYVKNHGKQRKRLQQVNARAKVVEKMATKLGPKPFNVDRLLAIFYAILDEKVGLTCNLRAQISTLVHLKLLTYAAGDGGSGGAATLDGSATRLQCTVGMDFILQIGRMVGFNVRQYLTDFF